MLRSLSHRLSLLVCTNPLIVPSLVSPLIVLYRHLMVRGVGEPMKICLFLCLFCRMMLLTSYPFLSCLLCTTSLSAALLPVVRRSIGEIGIRRLSVRSTSMSMS